MDKVLIGISGRSCSGKSAASEALAVVNHNLLLIRGDWYFRKTASSGICIERPDSLDSDRLVENLRAILAGRTATIKIETLWMQRADVEISAADIRKAELVLVDGFLLFTVKKLTDLLDYKIFIDVSDEELLRRRMARNGSGQYEYIRDVVIPISKEYEAQQKASADLIVNGNESQEKVVDTVARWLRGQLKQTTVNLPAESQPWQVRFGDLLMDAAWHPIAFADLKPWVKAKDGTTSELKGNTFRYRATATPGYYEIRMSSQYGPRIYRYTSDNSPSH
jgi:uridine kinase